MGPKQVLPLRVKMDQGVMAKKGYSTFTKAPKLASPSDSLVSYPGHLLVGRSYPSAEMQWAYSTDPPTELGNEGLLHTPQSSRTGASPADTI